MLKNSRIISSSGWTRISSSRRPEISDFSQSGNKGNNFIKVTKKCSILRALLCYKSPSLMPRSATALGRLHGNMLTNCECIILVRLRSLRWHIISNSNCYSKLNVLLSCQSKPPWRPLFYKSLEQFKLQENIKFFELLKKVETRT